MPRPTLDIAEEVGRRIASGEPCWFPGLADMLVASYWESARDVDRAGYSTEAWLSGMPPGAMLAVPGQIGMNVEELPAALNTRFEALSFFDVAPMAAPAIAAALVRLEPMGAGEVVASVARSIHCIAARGPGYDCSHSEPSIPFSIFVSIPLGERHAELRLAESILHEAMHLQLTLIERHAPIVVGAAGRGYSPWQRSERPVLGLLHGLYVFAAIHRWLQWLSAEPALSPDDREYIDRRSREIEEEMRLLGALSQCSGLTDFGRSLTVWLLDPFRAVSASCAAADAVSSRSGRPGANSLLPHPARRDDRRMRH